MLSHVNVQTGRENDPVETQYSVYIGTNVFRGDGHEKLAHKAQRKTDATLLDVTCCVRLHTLLLVVACCWELLRKVCNRSNVWLRANEPNNSQNCWANNVGNCCVRLHVAS